MRSAERLPTAYFSSHTMKERLREKLSLSSKLRLKRALFAPVVWGVRLAARVYHFAGRVAASAEANGVDLRRAFDVPQRPGPPHAQAWGASDFLFLARTEEGPEQLVARGLRSLLRFRLGSLGFFGGGSPEFAKACNHSG